MDIEDSIDIQVVALKIEAGAGAKHDVSHDDQSPAGCSGAVCGQARSNTAHPAGGRPSHRTPQLPTATTTSQQHHSSIQNNTLEIHGDSYLILVAVVRGDCLVAKEDTENKPGSRRGSMVAAAGGRG